MPRGHTNASAHGAATARARELHCRRPPTAPPTPSLSPVPPLTPSLSPLPPLTRARRRRRGDDGHDARAGRGGGGDVGGVGHVQAAPDGGHDCPPGAAAAALQGDHHGGGARALRVVCVCVTGRRDVAFVCGG
eukprot:3556260-Prymnesium_polylepis.1